jgi:hypothetical protein
MQETPFIDICPDLVKLILKRDWLVFSAGSSGDCRLPACSRRQLADDIPSMAQS